MHNETERYRGTTDGILEGPALIYMCLEGKLPSLLFPKLHDHKTKKYLHTSDRYYFPVKLRSLFDAEEKFVEMISVFYHSHVSLCHRFTITWIVRILLEIV